MHVEAVLSSTSLTLLFFLPFCVFQVYVSYDYGKSFNKISEKLNFGVGNSSEAVISQFYHSPADNKRVRRLWLGSIAFWEDGCTEGRLGHGSPLLALQHMWVTSYCLQSNLGLGDRTQFSWYDLCVIRVSTWSGRISEQTRTGSTTENLPTSKLPDLTGGWSVS